MKKNLKRNFKRWIAFLLAVVVVATTCIHSSDAFLWATGDEEPSGTDAVVAQQEMTVSEGEEDSAGMEDYLQNDDESNPEDEIPVEEAASYTVRFYYRNPADETAEWESLAEQTIDEGDTVELPSNVPVAPAAVPVAPAGAAAPPAGAAGLVAVGDEDVPLGVAAVVDDDGNVTFVPITEDEIPLADRELDDHKCCILSFLLMLATLIIYSWFTHSMKKRQKKLAELKDQLAEETLKRQLGITDNEKRAR